MSRLYTLLLGLLLATLPGCLVVPDEDVIVPDADPPVVVPDEKPDVVPDLPDAKGKMRVLILAETNDIGKYPVGQANIFTSAIVEKWFMDNGASVRVWDPHVDGTLEPDPFWRETALKIKRGDIKWDSLPWVVIYNGERGSSVALPATVDEMLKFLDGFKPLSSIATPLTEVFIEDIQPLTEEEFAEFQRKLREEKAKREAQQEPSAKKQIGDPVWQIREVRFARRVTGALSPLNWILSP